MLIVGITRPQSGCFSFFFFKWLTFPNTSDTSLAYTNKNFKKLKTKTKSCSWSLQLSWHHKVLCRHVGLAPNPAVCLPRSSFWHPSSYVARPALRKKQKKGYRTAPVTFWGWLGGFASFQKQVLSNGKEPVSKETGSSYSHFLQL